MEKDLRFIKKTREYRADEESDGCRKELEDFMSKRIQTTMIGALASVEKYFEFLWRDDRELREVFRKLRKEILDKGNDQIDLVKNDLDRYQVRINRYRYDFRIGE